MCKGGGTIAIRWDWLVMNMVYCLRHQYLVTQNGGVRIRLTEWSERSRRQAIDIDVDAHTLAIRAGAYRNVSSDLASVLAYDSQTKLLNGSLTPVLGFSGRTAV